MFVNAGAGDDVFLRLDGKLIGTARSLTLNTIEAEKDIADNRPSVTLSGTGVLTDHGRDLFANMFQKQPLFDVVETMYKCAPPRPIRSKKKRLRKKWNKQYEDSILRKVVYRNVSVEGMS